MKRFMIIVLLSSFIIPVMSQEDNVSPVATKRTELHETGCVDNAVKSYQKGLDISPDPMLIYFEMAYSCACKNEIEKSIEYAEKAMYIDDEFQEMFYLWMFYIATEGRGDEVILEEEADDVL